MAAADSEELSVVETVVRHFQSRAESQRVHRRLGHFRRHLSIWACLRARWTYTGFRDLGEGKVSLIVQDSKHGDGAE